MTRLLALLLLVTPAAVAAEPVADPDAARMQAAEAAVRAGRSRSQVIQKAAPRQMNTETPARGRSADGFFPLPPRSGDGSVRGGGVQSLIAASAAQSAAKAASTADDGATAQGLAAIEAARRNIGAGR